MDSSGSAGQHGPSDSMHHGTRKVRKFFSKIAKKFKHKDHHEGDDGHDDGGHDDGVHDASGHVPDSDQDATQGHLSHYHGTHDAHGTGTSESTPGPSSTQGLFAGHSGDADHGHAGTAPEAVRHTSTADMYSSGTTGMGGVAMRGPQGHNPGIPSPEQILQMSYEDRRSDVLQASRDGHIGDEHPHMLSLKQEMTLRGERPSDHVDHRSGHDGGHDDSGHHEGSNGDA